MSSEIPVGGTSAVIGAIRSAQPAPTSEACTSATPRTWRQISHTPTSPQAWPAGTGGGPSLSSTWTSFTRPGPIGVAPLDSSIATRARGARPANASTAGQLSRRVEEDAIEADVAAVEGDRLVDVADADPDMVDSLEDAHAISTASLTNPVSTRISRIRSQLAAIRHRQAGRTAPLRRAARESPSAPSAGSGRRRTDPPQPPGSQSLGNSSSVRSGVLRAPTSTLPLQTSSQKCGVGAAPERAAADEAVTAVLEQELERLRRP